MGVRIERDRRFPILEFGWFFEHFFFQGRLSGHRNGLFHRMLVHFFGLDLFILRSRWI